MLCYLDGESVSNLIHIIKKKYHHLSLLSWLVQLEGKPSISFWRLFLFSLFCNCLEAHSAQRDKISSNDWYVQSTSKFIIITAIMYNFWKLALHRINSVDLFYGSLPTCSATPCFSFDGTALLVHAYLVSTNTTPGMMDSEGLWASGIWLHPAHFKPRIFFPPQWILLWDNWAHFLLSQNHPNISELLMLLKFNYNGAGDLWYLSYQKSSWFHTNFPTRDTLHEFFPPK